MAARLSDLTPGQQGRIASLRGPAATRRRLAELGLVGGAQVTLVRVAPLGDPLEFRVGSGMLALRRDTAREVLLEGSA